MLKLVRHDFALLVLHKAETALITKCKRTLVLFVPFTELLISSFRFFPKLLITQNFSQIRVLH